MGYAKNFFFLNPRLLWAGGSRSHSQFFFFENRPKIALKIVAYYVLSVLSMSVMGFQKNKSLDGGGWVG